MSFFGKLIGFASNQRARAWDFEDDFSTYANEAAAVTAGYTFAFGWSGGFDAANDECDVLGNGNLTAVLATLGAPAIVDSTSYEVEVVITNFVTGPLQVSFQGGTPTSNVNLVVDGNGIFRATIISDTSNTSVAFDANAATELSLSVWRMAPTATAPA